MATFDFTGGVTGSAAYGQRNKILFSNTWAAGDTWTLKLNGTISGDITLGSGYLGSANPAFGFVFKNRVYLANGSQFNFSGVEENSETKLISPTGWEEQDDGAGFIPFLSQYGNQDSVISFCVFQGKLVVFGQKSIQVWTTSANPAQFVLEQVLPGTGTKAAMSVQPYGELDVLYLDHGVRSLKAKELTLNAFVEDIGTSIDSIVQAKLATCSEAEIAGACGIIDPLYRRYYLFLKDTMYVLSYFPRSQILAWSTITNATLISSSTTVATFSGTFNSSGRAYVTLTDPVGTKYFWYNATGYHLHIGDRVVPNLGSFTQETNPSTAYIEGTPGATVSGTPNVEKLTFKTGLVIDKLVEKSNVVYARVRETAAPVGLDYLGSFQTTATLLSEYPDATVETPWLDFGSPTARKLLTAIDVAFSGRWVFYISTDYGQTAVEVYRGGTWTSPNSATESTYDLFRIPAEFTGTHFKFKAETVGGYSAKLSEIIFHYKKGDND